MLPPIPPSRDELRRARARVAVVKAAAHRRRLRRRAVVGVLAAGAAAAALSAWLVPARSSSTVRVIAPPTSATVPIPSVLTPGPTGPSTTRETTPVAAGGPMAATFTYAGPGVTVVGVAPAGIDSWSRPAQLYLSTDMVHWRDVTPPAALRPDRVVGGYSWFEQASFLDPSTGWVTAYDGDTITATIYRTDDGGRTWSAVAGGGHSIHPRATLTIDLVSPTTAFEEQVEPTGPAMSVSVTTDAGRTWKVVYTGSPQATDQPFELPTTFLDRQHGFAAAGSPMTVLGLADGGFYSTSDGGASWRREHPPLPATTATCPSAANRDQASGSCVFTLPAFADGRDGVVAGVVSAGTEAAVAVDRSSDGGTSWRKVVQVQVPVAPNFAQFGPAAPAGYPVIALGSATTWWVVGWRGSTAITELTTDGGATWTTHQASIAAGVPGQLTVLDTTHALLTVEHSTRSGTTSQVVETADGGRHWAPLELTGPDRP